MGLFGIFRKKSPADVIEQELLRLAPILFPGGHQQIQSTGQSISAILDNQISPDDAARIYASTKYLAHTAEDKSKPRVVQYIVKQGLGIISLDDASAIYDRFISPVPPPGSVQPAQRSATDDTICINARLMERDFTLTNQTQNIRINAALFATALLSLRSSGWSGAAILFDSSSGAMKSLKGAYVISEHDAKEIATLLSDIFASQQSDPKYDAFVRPLITFAAQGKFTVQA